MPRFVKQGPAGLPPPGDARREVLAERADTLAEAAERASEDRGVIDPRAFRVENELAQHFDELSVSHALPDKHYKWVYTGEHGRHIRVEIADGWEVVQGDMPEAPELKGVGADTTRRLGDVILMRISPERFATLQQRARARQAAQEGAVASELVELGSKYRDRGIVVHEGLSAMNPRLAQGVQNRAHARRAATQFVDQHLREGDMPGLPAPGRA